jgi:Lrp/AsnC family transcriptional regulator for asnA, asnC and gidA
MLMIDALDAKIIVMLQADARTPNTGIAARLRVTEATVRKRIARLRRDGILQFGAWADPLKMGYQTYAVIELLVRPGHVEKVADRLARFPEILFLWVCSGRCDLMAAAILRSNEHLHELLTRRIGVVSGVQRMTTTNILRIAKRAYARPMPNDGDDGSRRNGRPRRPRSGPGDDSTKEEK